MQLLSVGISWCVGTYVVSASILIGELHPDRRAISEMCTLPCVKTVLIDFILALHKTCQTATTIGGGA
jgi:hypothetical protein